MNPWAVFITGLTTGGLTCVAVQGGLLMGYLANRQGEEGGSARRAVMVPVGRSSSPNLSPTPSSADCWVP